MLYAIAMGQIINCLVGLLTMSLHIAKAVQWLTGSLATAVVEVKADAIINYGHCAACTSACQ